MPFPIVTLQSSYFLRSLLVLWVSQMFLIFHNLDSFEEYQSRMLSYFPQLEFFWCFFLWLDRGSGRSQRTGASVLTSYRECMPPPWVTRMVMTLIAQLRQCLPGLLLHSATVLPAFTPHPFVLSSLKESHCWWFLSLLFKNFFLLSSFTFVFGSFQA